MTKVSSETITKTVTETTVTLELSETEAIKLRALLGSVGCLDGDLRNIRSELRNVLGWRGKAHWRGENPILDRIDPDHQWGASSVWDE